MTVILQLILQFDTVRHRPLLQLCAPLSVTQPPFTPRNLELCTSHFPLSTMSQLLRPLGSAGRVEIWYRVQAFLMDGQNVRIETGQRGSQRVERWSNGWK